MDPDVNLAEQLEIANLFVICDHDGCLCPEKFEIMGELVLALHEWMSHGGFAPLAWRPKP